MEKNLKLDFKGFGFSPSLLNGNNGASSRNQAIWILAWIGDALSILMNLKLAKLKPRHCDLASKLQLAKLTMTNRR